MEKTIAHKSEENTLIMKGGGIKGLAYVGALEELTKYYNFNWYAGTSAGAISAILLASGFTIVELKEILMKKDFNDFKDANFFKKYYNLVAKKGFYEAESFNSWLNNLLAKKLDSPNAIELKDLPYRVTVYASRREKKALVFDSTDEETKHKRAVFAARCSMSIPIFFTPQKSEGLSVFDGGAQNNYPVKILLENNPSTKFIGLYIGSEHYEHPKKVNIFKEMLAIWTEAMDYEALKEYKDQTIIIDTKPISTLKFSLNKFEKEFLLESGRLGALKFLIKEKKIINASIDQRIQNHEKNRKKLFYLKKKKRLIRKSIVWIIISVLAYLSYSSIDFNDNNPVANNDNSPFNVTVVVHGKQGKDDRILKNQGKVVLDFGTTREEEPINSKGIATFKEIPSKYLGDSALISINHSQPYFPIQRNLKHVLSKNKIYLEAELKGLDIVFGRVLDHITERPLDSVIVSVRNEKVFTNELGWFELNIPQSLQSKFVRINFFKTGYIITTLDSIAPHTKQEIGIRLKPE